MKADVNMKQLVDIKLLLPTIADALGGGQGFTLNMIGPINIGGSVGEGNEHRRKQNELLPITEKVYLNSDDIFAEDLTMAEFHNRAKLHYFKIMATRHNFSRRKLENILALSSTSVSNYAKTAGINLGR